MSTKVKNANDVVTKILKIDCFEDKLDRVFLLELIGVLDKQILLDFAAVVEPVFLWVLYCFLYFDFVNCNKHWYLILTTLFRFLIVINYIVKIVNYLIDIGVVN